ncbi:uncharacterized protein [Ptychodera flava]|uniref:uncharacterized protein n=1 Tax=Ptychodera flava TaxID=63121 RepID=UPI00396AAD80
MAGINIGDVAGIKPFDPTGDPNSVGTRWKRWLKSFTMYADSKGLIIEEGKDDNKQQRRALLLHSAGEEVQAIFETLDNTGDAKDYKKAEEALNKYFQTQVNTTYENHLFRAMQQHENESVAQFVTRLKQAVKDCDYGDQSDKQIRDQVVENCRSTELRRKLLEKGKALTLTQVLEISSAYEAVQIQLEGMAAKSPFSSINRVQGNSTEKKQFYRGASTQNKKPSGNCYRCSRTGHFGRDPECPARGKICAKCGKPDHFAAQCKSKSTNPKASKPKGNRGGKGKREEKENLDSL